MTTIISALISAGVTLIVCLINNHVEQNKTTALLSYKIDELTKRVDKHNNLVERMYGAESDIKTLKEKQNVLEKVVEMRSDKND